MAECIVCKREGESSCNATFKREEERKTRKIFLRIIYTRTRVDKKNGCIFLSVSILFGARTAWQIERKSVNDRSLVDTSMQHKIRS